MLVTSNRVVVVDAVMVEREAAVRVEEVVVMHAKLTASRIAAAVVVVTLVQVATKE
jgi:hypothetical protein